MTNFQEKEVLAKKAFLLEIIFQNTCIRATRCPNFCVCSPKVTLLAHGFIIAFGMPCLHATVAKSEELGNVANAGIIAAVRMICQHVPHALESAFYPQCVVAGDTIRPLMQSGPATPLLSIHQQRKSKKLDYPA